MHYSTSICSFESGNCRKEGKKLQKFEYLENEKSFFDEIKNIFYSFWRAIYHVVKKIKIWSKLADTSFKDDSWAKQYLKRVDAQNLMQHSL